MLYTLPTVYSTSTCSCDLKGFVGYPTASSPHHHHINQFCLDVLCWGTNQMLESVDRENACTIQAVSQFSGCILQRMHLNTDDVTARRRRLSRLKAPPSKCSPQMPGLLGCAECTAQGHTEGDAGLHLWESGSCWHRLKTPPGQSRDLCVRRFVHTHLCQRENDPNIQ